MPQTLTRIIFSIVLGVLAAKAIAQEPALADYGTLPAIQMLAISPSGNIIAFRKTNNTSDQVIVYSLTQNKMLRGADVSSTQPRRMYFISDNELILVASQLKRLWGYRDEFAMSTAFVMNVKSGDIRQLLTPGDRIYLGQSGLGNIVGISPDKKYLYMPAFVGKTESDQSPNLHLMKVKVSSPRGPGIMKKGRNNSVDYFVSPNGELIAQEVYSNSSNKHEIIANQNGKWVTVFKDESEIMRVSFTGVTPDQKALVMLEENPNTGRTIYSSLSLQDGAITRNLFGRDDADVESVLTDINRIAHGVIYSGFNPSYKFFDPKVDKRMQSIIEKFPDQSVWLKDWSDDWKHLVIYVEGPSSSGNFYLFSDGEAPRFLASARPNIAAEQVNPIGRVAFKARDGLIIPMLLTIPRNKAGDLKNLPAIMLPHGGPQAYDRIEFDWLAQAFASRGYLVIQPQFRGSDGFGAKHLSAGYGEWGQKMQDDLTDSLEFLIRKGIVDKTRVCTVGASYGGYAALVAGAFTPDLYRCIVSLNGVSDLPGMLDFERKKHGKNHWIVSYFELFMVKGEATDKKLAALSPVNFAKNFTAPVLLIHGQNDETVPFEQSDDMYDNLRSAKKAVQLIELKDENHHLMSSEHRLNSLEKMVEFIDQHIGATPLVQAH
ncbi:prolyl oligopeptidase family serine peptidase [Simiduia curdlanivorans]|uniref:Alpha/beta hydrolase family protein n=1 Tax=Simiduia curdlanivorans TaxID=1492769 RepID=A0ABV8V640_9GAMM|nr:prolyl oligopeptidase family serine peptidase [Simiduia curdlanivorans]MDN3638698.1 prolyl oligopeptidase family serine peptidase [Simiduia curdlanivorans]